jgi:hypothetical protein
MQGHTQEEAAAAVSVGRRSLQRWEGSPWWSEAVAVARERWMHGTACKVRLALWKLLDAEQPDPRVVMWAAERLWAEFAAPATRLELTGTGGGPVALAAVDHRKVLAEALQRVKRNQEHHLALAAGGAADDEEAADA